MATMRTFLTTRELSWFVMLQETKPFICCLTRLTAYQSSYSRAFSKACGIATADPISSVARGLRSVIRWSLSCGRRVKSLDRSCDGQEAETIGAFWSQVRRSACDEAKVCATQKIEARREQFTVKSDIMDT